MRFLLTLRFLIPMLLRKEQCESIGRTPHSFMARWDNAVTMAKWWLSGHKPFRAWVAGMLWGFVVGEIEEPLRVGERVKWIGRTVVFQHTGEPAVSCGDVFQHTGEPAVSCGDVLEIIDIVSDIYTLRSLTNCGVLWRSSASDLQRVK